MFKKRWFFLALLVCSLFFAGSVFQTPWLAKIMLRRILASKPGVVVHVIGIGSQHFDLPGRFEFQGIKVVLTVNDKPLALEVPMVELTGVHSWWSRDKRILVNARHAQVRYDAGMVNDMAVQLTVVPGGISGPFTAVSLSWDKWRARDIAAFFILNPYDLEMRALKFRAYDGQVTGKVMVYFSRRPCAYAAEIFADGLDVEQMADVNADLALQLNGRVTGSASFEGDAQTLRVLDTSLVMPAGGKVNASLLAALTQYLPASREKKRLDVLIANGGKLAMEACSFTMKGGEEGKFSGELRLRSREINLELNLTHEINTDGTVTSLLAYWQKYLK